MKCLTDSLVVEVMKQQAAELGRECRVIESAILADSILAIVYDVKPYEDGWTKSVDRRYCVYVLGERRIGSNMGYSGIVGYRQEPWDEVHSEALPV